MDVARLKIQRGGVPSEVYKYQSHKEDDVEDDKEDVGALQKRSNLSMKEFKYY